MQKERIIVKVAKTIGQMIAAPFVVLYFAIFSYDDGDEERQAEWQAQQKHEDSLRGK